MNCQLCPVFNVVAFSIFTPFAQLYAATSRVTILVYTMPIWASLLARLVLGERLNATRAVALALCVAGMAVLIYPLAATGIPAGILLALGAAMSWAAGTVGRSPSITTDATIPTAGTLKTPSEAVIAGSRRTMSNQRK